MPTPGPRLRDASLRLYGSSLPRRACSGETRKLYVVPLRTGTAADSPSPVRCRALKVGQDKTQGDCSGLASGRAARMRSSLRLGAGAAGRRCCDCSGLARLIRRGGSVLLFALGGPGFPCSGVSSGPGRDGERLVTRACSAQRLEARPCGAPRWCWATGARVRPLPHKGLPVSAQGRSHPPRFS